MVEQKKSILYTFIFAVSVFLQLMYFHFLVTGIPFRSIVSNPAYFWSAFLPKISIALMLGSLAFLSKKKKWTLFFSFFLDLWIIAELCYFRVNGIFLDKYSITMAGNMKGFWDSILVCVSLRDLIFPLISAILVILFRVLRCNDSRVLPAFFAVFFLSIATHIGDVYCLNKLNCILNKSEQKVSISVSQINPFSEKENAIIFWGATAHAYIRETSAFHAFIKNTYMLTVELLSSKEGQYILNEEDKTQIKQLIISNLGGDINNGRLYIILVESLENWAISPLTCPNIYDFFENHENCLWVKRIKKQTKGGTSGDGQMIINTGLLPVNEGAACFRFPNNKYPSISSLYDKAGIIVPGDPNVWNQVAMNKAYGIDSEFSISPAVDSLVVVKLCDEYKEFSFLMALTIASHAPFVQFADKSPLIFDREMPSEMRNYLNCIHYSDDCLGRFLKLVDEDELLSNSTIVITGDHTIFDNDSRSKFNEYCVSHNADYSVKENYCPLIVYSPKIEHKTIIDEECYQMDIFPTILNLTGNDDYFWKGFGKDLLDENSSRPFNEKEAYDLSDKIFRSNYFSSIESEEID